MKTRLEAVGWKGTKGLRGGKVKDGKGKKENGRRKRERGVNVQ